MAGERKENSVLFTLKELKDITADDPEPAERPVQAARPKARRSSAFIDEADSLLADIRDVVGADAEAEAERIEAERRATEEAERRAQSEAEERQRAEIEARLAAEAARRRAAEEERQARAHAIDIAERRARGEIIDEPAPQAQPAQRALPVMAASPAQPQQPSRGTGFYLTVVGLPIICLTAVAITLILRQNEPMATQRQQAAQAPAAPTEVVALGESPKEPEVEPAAVVAEGEDEDEAADAGAPDAATDAGEAKVAKKSRSKRRKRRRTKKKAETAGKSDDGKGKKKLKLKLGDDKGITF